MYVTTGRELTSLPLPPFTLTDPDFHFAEANYIYPNLYIPSLYTDLARSLFDQYTYISPKLKMHVFFNAHAHGLIYSPHPTVSLSYFIRHTISPKPPLFPTSVKPGSQNRTSLSINFDTYNYILDDSNPINPPQQVFYSGTHRLSLPPLPPLPTLPTYVQHKALLSKPLCSISIFTEYLAPYIPLSQFLYSDSNRKGSKLALALDYSYQELHHEPSPSI